MIIKVKNNPEYLTQKETDKLLKNELVNDEEKLLFSDKVLQLLKQNMKDCNRTIITASLKLSEEVGEVAEAVIQNYSDNNYKQKTEEDIIKECIDVMIVSMSIILLINPDIKEMDLKNHVINQLLRWNKIIKEYKNENHS